jgi:uncharacterized membrane protein YphA (DoxX/SURF4 family)
MKAASSSLNASRVHGACEPPLRRLKIAARLGLGFVWVWEGLVPKILNQTPAEVEMVRHSGLWWVSPEITLQWLGAAMILAGLIVMSGIKERLAVLVATAAVLILMVLVIRNEPASVVDPYGGLAKDACLFVCAAVVWWLAPLTNGQSSGRSFARR